MRAWESWDLLRSGFQAWTGIELPQSSSSLALEALAELSHADGVSPQQFLERALQHENDGRRELIARLVVNTTWFMREAAGVHALVAALKRTAARDGDDSVRVWSAGCSTGQEPYTLVMALLEAGLDPRVLATDISNTSLGVARVAIYPSHRINGLPPGWIRRHLEHLPDGRVRVRDHVTKRVTFANHNLAAGREPPGIAWTGLDAVVCRNVLIYFDRDVAVEMINDFGGICRPEGYVLLGAAEQPLVWMTDRLVVADDLPDAVLLRPVPTRDPSNAANGSARNANGRLAGGRSSGADTGRYRPSIRVTQPMRIIELDDDGDETTRSARDTARPGRRRARHFTPHPAETESPEGGERRRGAPRDEPPRREATTRPRAPRPTGAPIPPDLEEAERRSHGGDLPGALALLDALVARDPVLAPAHLSRGLVLKRLGRTDDAVQAFRKARFLTTDEGWMAPYQLGLCLEQLGRLAEAREAYRHALAILDAGGPSGLVRTDDDDVLASTASEAVRFRLQGLQAVRR